MKKYMYLLIVFLLSGCSFFSDKSTSSIADMQEEKLRQYFTYGRSDKTDLSTLISETRAVSARLKSEGNYARANKFDSYTDVLMYGNRTLDESIRDTQQLVKSGGGYSGKSSSCSTSINDNSTICRWLHKILP
ncbi:MAG: hypothetical protein IJ730_06360 [Alphaproteobacteria bacterium]|nr:hypothetical protein [Alphaproteobacteria bacterium]